MLKIISLLFLCFLIIGHNSSSFAEDPSKNVYPVPNESTNFWHAIENKGFNSGIWNHYPSDIGKEMNKTHDEPKIFYPPPPEEKKEKLENRVGGTNPCDKKDPPPQCIVK
jgi:hypothetical protein